VNKERISVEKFENLIAGGKGQVKDKIIEGDWSYFYVFERYALSIKNCDFIGNIEISALNENNRVYFIDCKFLNKFYVDSISTELILNFQDCVFSQKASFSASNKLWLTFINSVLEDEVEFVDIVENSQIRIHSNKSKAVNFKKKILITSCSARLMDINKALISEIEFQYTSPQDIYIRESTISIFKTLALRDFNKLIINKSKIGIIDAQYLLLTGLISIDFCKIDKVNFSNYESKGGLTKFFDVQIYDFLNLKKSSLKGMEFSNIYMKDAKLILDNSFLNEFRFSNIVWPIDNIVVSENQLLESKYDEKENAYVLREVYRQLKNAAKAQSSNIEALNFYRNEMVEYSRYTYNNSDVNFWDRLIIRVNKCASDFGQSVIRPLVGLCTIHLLLFTILIAINGSDRISFVDLHDHNWTYFWRGFGEFFYLLNPTHSFLDYQFGLIDFLMRVSSGFFIYHFVKATRKYSF